MGTRAAFGVRIDGKDKLSYNHWDGYPSGLGQRVFDVVKKYESLDTLKVDARRLQAVNDDFAPTKEHIELSKQLGLLDTSVDQARPDGKPSWYQLLRGSQGYLDRVLAVGLYLDANDFILDSLFCEWAYIVNLDALKFEIYKGFQREPHTQGRYASATPNKGDYYPCALVEAYDLRNLPDVFYQESGEEEE